MSPSIRSSPRYLKTEQRPKSDNFKFPLGGSVARLISFPRTDDGTHLDHLTEGSPV